MSAGSGAGAVLCAHCALPVTELAGARRRPRTSGATVAPGAADGGERFCCSGCFLAWHLTGRDLEGPSDRLLARLVLSAFLAMGVMVFSLALYGRFLDAADAHSGEAAAALTGLLRLAALALTSVIVALLVPAHLRAVVALRRYLSADALVLAGTLAAYAVSVWSTFAGGGEVYFETAAMVLVLFTLGKWMDVHARERARARLSSVVAADAEHAARVRAAGGGAPVAETVAAADLRRGDRVRVGAGEVVPVDGTVASGRAAADGSALTGESEPRALGAGDRVLAGVRLVEGELVVRAEAVRGERVRDEIQRLLDAALERPAHLTRLADRVAAVLLPSVLVLALGTALWHAPRAGAEAALTAALSVVLISCPCALGIATPLAFWTALSEAWRRGVLVRGSEVFERLARVERVLLDKTGTLTSGGVELVAVEPAAELGRDELLRAAAALEAGSEHPLARALLGAWRAGRGGAAADGAAGLDGLPAVAERRVLPGVGIEARLDGVPWRLVRHAAPDDDDGAPAHGARPGSAHGSADLWRAGERVASFRFRSELHTTARPVVAELARRGLEPRVLTGDARGPARSLAAALGVPVEARLLPADKVARVEAAGRAGTLFVGDGINDAPALAAADVGVAVSGASGPSLEAADVHLLGARLDALPELLDLARRAVRTARGNLFWAFAYNAVGLWLAASGRLTPLFAASAMVASSALVVLHSGRARLPSPAPQAPPAESDPGSRGTVRTLPSGATEQGVAPAVGPRPTLVR